MKDKSRHYYLYIDDHGSRNPDHEPDIRDDGMNCFSFGGILVRYDDIDSIVSSYKKFCLEWKISYSLHSTDIRGMRKDFRWLQDNTKDASRFHIELNNFLKGIPVIGFATVVNRPGYNTRYKDKYGNDRWQLCKTSYSILVERVAKYVSSQNGTFEVYFEQSGKKEDRTLKHYAKSLKTEGLPFNKNSSKKYTPLSNNDFRRLMLGEPREKSKKCIFTQIADLYLYPMVKRKYDLNYRAWIELYSAKRVIDAILEGEALEENGIKYSCFDENRLGSKKPETSSG